MRASNHTVTEGILHKLAVCKMYNGFSYATLMVLNSFLRGVKLRPYWYSEKRQGAVETKNLWLPRCPAGICNISDRLDLISGF